MNKIIYTVNAYIQNFGKTFSISWTDAIFDHTQGKWVRNLHADAG